MVTLSYIAVVQFDANEYHINLLKKDAELIASTRYSTLQRHRPRPLQLRRQCRQFPPWKQYTVVQG